MLLGLGHVDLVCRDLTRSLAFYLEVFVPLGLAYVITVALMTVVIGTLFLREPRGAKIWSEVGGEEPGLMTEATPAD